MESGTIEVLKDAGKQGILLAELVKKTEQSESKILQIIDSLTENGQVKKVEESHDGKATLRIFWQGEEESEWDTLEGCPCFICPDIDQCGAGQPTSPWVCDKLNNWIKERLD
ncbi:MAG: hypothetical protein ACFFBR_05370 [Promethearchaeota archaeon]